MKAAFAILATFVILAAAPAYAQDWVMDWTSTGHDLLHNWSISGTSAATLSNVPSSFGGLPPSFNTPVHILGWTYQGQGFGGYIAEGPFQTPDFAAPVSPQAATPVPGRFHPEFPDSSSGTFTLSGSSFSLDLNMGTGHFSNHLVATGRLASTASAAEPTVLLLSGAGLVAAAALRRLRRS
jgi:hypothetical protein